MKTKASGPMPASSSAPVPPLRGPRPGAPFPEREGDPLEGELAATREHLQTVVEEMAIVNEELHATNEELETANEELQATNEELVSLNEELCVKTAELSKLTEEYSHLYDALQFPILVFDRTLRLQRFNAAAERFFGLRFASLDTPVSSPAMPPVLGALEPLLQRAREGRTREDETWSEQGRTLRLNVTPGLDKSGVVKNLVASLFDISDIARAQALLAESEARLAALMERTTVIFAMKDLAGHYLYANRSFLEFFGIDPGDYAGKTDFALLPPALAADLWALDLAALRRQATTGGEHVVELDGRRRHLRSVHQVLLNGEGQPSGFTIEAEDVTARRQAEKAIQESERRFRATFEQAAVGLAHVGIDGRLLRVNEKFCTIVGYGREELLQRGFREITHAADRETDRESLSNLLAGEIAHYSVEKRYVRRDGSQFWGNLTVSLVQGAGSEPDYLVAVLEDIQRRKDAEHALAAERRSHQQRLERQVAKRTAQLMAANRELQSFSYAASHDLRAPLGRINSFGALLEQKYRDRLDGDGLFFLSLIRSNATRMTALIDDLLSYAQIEQKTLLRPVCLLEAVEAALGERAEDIRQGGVEIRLTLAAVAVLANPQGLAQVLRNLLENALKYSRQASPPVIEIGGGSGDGKCRLWVRDNGIGFDMAYHDRIFEIFRRLHTYEEFQGSGVGLALVKKAMDGMGGRVWGEGRPGEGATFFLEFQAAPCP